MMEIMNQKLSNENCEVSNEFLTCLGTSETRASDCEVENRFLNSTYENKSEVKNE